MTWPFPYDGPLTLAGQIQRGLGRGFVAALNAPHVEVHAILLDCVLHESRLDHQIDSRGWYYGELAFRTGLPVEPLESHLVDSADDEAGDGWLALDVLGRLAIRGRPEAIDVLRRYVHYGGWWATALQELGRCGRPGSWEGLEEIAASRISDDTPSVSFESEAEPFATWFREVPVFVDAWERARSDAGNREVERERLRNSETTSLLAPPFTKIHDRASILAGRTSDEDSRVLAASLHHEDALVRALAACVLAEQNSTAGFEAARNLLLGSRGWRGLQVRSFATRALVAMPGEVVLPLAREWRSSRRHTLRRAAWEILARHADRDDIPWLRRQLRRKCAIESEYELSEAAELARRLWHPAMLADLHRLFPEFRSSSLRTRIAGTLAEMDVDFAATVATECLWDCEAETRLLGVTRADRGYDIVAARIAEMAADPAEDEQVRIAAMDTSR